MCWLSVVVEVVERVTVVVAVQVASFNQMDLQSLLLPQ
jgi:hypothetical protein